MPRLLPLVVLMTASFLAACNGSGLHTAAKVGTTPTASPLAKPGGKSTIISEGGNGVVPPTGPGVISNNAGSLVGVALVPASIVANNGGSLVSEKGGGIVSHNGGNILPHNGGGLLSDAGGNLTSKVKRELLSTKDEAPLLGFTVTITDAAGKPVLDDQGKPYTAVTDDAGYYSFAQIPKGQNLVLRLALPDQVGTLLAYLPDASDPKTPVDVDGVSTLVMGYILDKYVQGQQATLQKLPASAEADTRAKAQAALNGAIALASAQPAAIDAAVDDLRTANPAFDTQVKYVQSLLVAGQAHLGDGRPGTQVALSVPHSLARLSDGSFVIAENIGHRVRRLWPDGTITTIAGKEGATSSGDGGPATEAALVDPYELAVDAHDNIYLTDRYGERIRRIDANGNISTAVGDLPATHASGVSAPAPVADPTSLAGKVASQAPADLPAQIALDDQGQPVFTCQTGLFRVAPDGTLAAVALNGLGVPTHLTRGKEGLYAYDFRTGQVSLLGATGLVPRPNTPLQPGHAYSHLAVAPDGTLYLSAIGALWKLDAGAWKPVALPASISQPEAMVVDGNALVLIDLLKNLVWRMPLDGSPPTLLAGVPPATTDGVKAEDLGLSTPGALAFDTAGNFYVADGASAVVWQRRSDGLYYRFAGAVDGTGGTGSNGDEGPAREARLGKVLDIAFNAVHELLISELSIEDYKPRLRRVDAAGLIHSVALPANDPLQSLGQFVSTADGTLYGVGWLEHQIVRIQGDTAVVVVPIGKLKNPTGLCQRPDGSFLVADADGLYTLTGDTLARIAGTPGVGFAGDGGSALAAKFNGPVQVIQDASGNIFVSDAQNNRIRRIDAKTNVITTVAGLGGKVLAGAGGAADTLKQPLGLAFDANGDLYIADSGNNQVKRIEAATLTNP